MFSSIVVVIIVFVFLLFFMFYKRDMLIKMFSIDVTSSANRFQQQLEQTADIVIKRLEDQISHLEYLLDEANEKILSLDEKIQLANKMLAKENSNSLLSATNLVMPDITIEKNGKVNSTDIPENIISANEPVSLSNNKPIYIMHADIKTSIVEMAALGYDVNEIAKTTGVSKGEIILLLQLNKK